MSATLTPAIPMALAQTQMVLLYVTVFLDSPEMDFNALTSMSAWVIITVPLMQHVRMISAHIHVNVIKDIKVMASPAVI